MEFEFLPCPTCREVTLVEIPPCPDAHGGDCPDRACTQCGTALALDGALLAAAAPRRTRPPALHRGTRAVA